MSEMSFCSSNKLKETQNSRKYLSSWVLLKLIKLIKHFCCFEAKVLMKNLCEKCLQSASSLNGLMNLMKNH